MATTDIPIPQTLVKNPKELERLRQAFGFFYDEENKEKVIYQAPPDPRFQKVTDFVDYLYSSKIGIPKNASVKQIGIILEKWHETITNPPRYTESTIAKPPEKAAEENLPGEELRAQQEVERQKRESAAKEAAANAKRDVQNAIKRQQELHAQLKDKKIYRRANMPSSQPLASDKLQTYNILSQEASANPEKFTKELENEIGKRLKATAPDGNDEEIEYLAKEAALGVTQRLRGNSPAIEAATLYQLSQQKELLAEAASESADQLSRDIDDLLAVEIAKYHEQRRTLSSALGEDFADNFLGPQDLNEVQVTLSGRKEDGYEDYKLDSISENKLNFLDRQDNLFGYVQGKGTANFKSYFLKETGKFIESQIPKSALLSKAFEVTAVRSAFNIYVMGEPLVYTNLVGRIALETGHGPFLAWIGQVSGIDFGIVPASAMIGATLSPAIYASAASYAAATETLAVTGGVFVSEAFAGGAGVALDFATSTGFAGYSAATTSFAAGGFSSIAGTAGGAATTTAVTTAATTTVATGGAAAGGAAAGAAAGSAVPIIGTIIGAVVGFVVGVALPKIKEGIAKGGKFLKTGAGVGAGAALGYMTGLGIIPGAVIGGAGSLFLQGGVGGITSGISGVIGGGVTAARTASQLAFASMAGPLVGTLIAFPIIVTLILIIINSGAYIVPTAPLEAGAGQTIVSPYISVTKVANPPGPFENSDLPLTVEYTVTIGAKKSALTNVSIGYECSVIKENSNPTCPPPDPAIPTSFATIDPSSPVSFTYSHTYDQKYSDTFVTDTITVTADAIEQSNAQAAGSATIKIGKPPEDCPAPWPVDHGYISQGAKTQASHSVLEALDIGVSYVPVKATHTGVVVAASSVACYGNMVTVKSTCQGQEFISRYAHLSAIGVQPGKTVTLGQTIGISGNSTGGSGSSCSTGPHLHYDFKYTSGASPSWPSNPPYMNPPYVPTQVPRGCNGNCGVNW